jgi:carbon storage regulator CsrA
MLVLTRKHQEKIRIGDDITITVLRTKGKAVRLGIEAPANVPVIRGELTFEDRTGGQSRSAVEGTSTQTSDRPIADEGMPSANSMGRQSRWPADSHSQRGEVRPPGGPQVLVSHQRISRDQLSRLLTPSGPASGPLREMLDRRSLTT